ncbi:MAG: hypothetical protein R3349_05340 [Geminicoccaceae bacterium]|nr:hypothetical protein [Geminicoccaceae bacterium]
MRVFNRLHEVRAALALGVLVSGLLAAMPAFAYVGPGAGLTAIGSLVALFAAVGLAIVGFVWYPIKRLRRRRAGADKKVAEKPVEKAAG